MVTGVVGDIVSGAGDLIALVILFGVSILIHELAHLGVAVLCGMKVDAFSIGFGPALLKKNIKGTVVKLSAFPIGGYVALPQLDPAGMSAVQGKGDESNEPLPPIAAWKRILVSLSGSCGNILLAFLLAWVVFLAPSPAAKTGPAVIGAVSTNSPAYYAGLRAGDEVVAVDGEKVDSWHDYILRCTLSDSGKDVRITVRRGEESKVFSLPLEEDDLGTSGIVGVYKPYTTVASEVLDGSPAKSAGVQPGDALVSLAGIEVLGHTHFVELLQKTGGEETVLVVERDGERVAMGIKPEFSEDAGKFMVGIMMASLYESSPPWMRYKKPWPQIESDARSIGTVLKALVTPKTSRQAAKGLGGPVMIVTTLWISIQTSFLNAIGFLRFLNVNLAILNLLPIPVLDGGHVIFSLWEVVFRRPVHRKVVNALVNLFAILLLSVFVILTYRDVLKLDKIFSLFGN